MPREKASPLFIHIITLLCDLFRENPAILTQLLTQRELRVMSSIECCNLGKVEFSIFKQ